MQKTKSLQGKHVLLIDLDGTIADPFQAIGSSLRYAFDKLSLGKLSDDQIRKFIGPPLQQSLPDLFGFDANLTQKVVTTYREHHAVDGIAMYRPYDGIEQVIADLSEIYTLFVATSKPHIYAEQIVKQFKIRDFFNAVYGPELDGTRSNKTELLEYLVKNEGIDAGHCVMIGDRKHDITAGRNTGTKTLGVLWGFGSREELESHSADHIIERVDELTNAARMLTK